MADALSGVADDARGEAVAPRVVVDSFHRFFNIPAATAEFGAPPISVDVYVSERLRDPSVKVAFGPFQCSSEVWTTLDGLEALIGRLQATLVRARIAREQA